MAHYAVRGSNSSKSQPRPEEWQGRSFTGGAQTSAAARLTDMLESVRQEFEGLVQDNAHLKTQREDFEAKAAQQLNEMAAIKAAVQDLETVHQKARQQYEDELARLRAEISSIRTATAAAPPSSALGVSGVSIPLATQSQPMQGIERTSSYQGDIYDRDRGGDSLSQSSKRPKTDKKDDRVLDHYVSHKSPGAYLNDPPARSPPPSSKHEFPGDLDPNTVSAELRKEGADWFAMYNPRVPKALDVTLLHQFNHESVVCCVRFSKDGKLLATGCNRTAQIFDMRTGAMTCQLSDEGAQPDGDLYIRSVCFSPDGKFLATGAEDRQIRIWDIAKKRIRHLFEGHQQEIYSLDFSHDGRLIVSGSGDRTARIWDMETLECKILQISELEPADAGVTSVAISPDGRFVAAGSLDTVVRLWDVATGNLLERLRGHKDSVYSIAFTPDGKGLVSGSLDKTLKYWDLNLNARGGEKYARCIFDFLGHKDYVLSVAISHDGQWVVSGSKDRGVQFWDKGGQAQLMLQGHKNSVISIDLSPTGGSLATGSGDGQARVWGYSPL